MTDVSGIQKTDGMFVMEGTSYDLETLIMALQMERADLIDDQIKSQMEEIKDRNKQLKVLHEVMARAREAKSKARNPNYLENMVKDKKKNFEKTVLNPDVSAGGRTQSMSEWAEELGFKFITPHGNAKEQKADWDMNLENMKGVMDSLNSSSQMDMIRLQSLMNKRNQAFEMMSNALQKMSKTKETIVGNMR